MAKLHRRMRSLVTALGEPVFERYTLRGKSIPLEQALDPDVLGRHEQICR
jgi:hypothetical protein